MDLNNIPFELKAIHQWVGVDAESKIPINGKNMCNASSTNPSTWSCFSTIEDAISKGKLAYPGFVFNDNGIVGVDIDDGYDDDGFISRLACDIISTCGSYTEKSKSGRGFHILIKGTLPFKGKNNRNGVEIYKTARYFIMTGDTLLYDAIIDNQEAIDYIVDKYFPEMRESENKGVAPKIYTPIWEKPMIDGRIKLRPVYPLIPDGCRNICLTSLAGMLHNQGYSPQQIYDEISYCNTVACEPMLPERELETIVGSVTMYKR